MVKPLSFKGDVKSHKKKRKRAENENAEDGSRSKALVTTTANEADDDENWVSADVVTDITGPVVLVLSTKPVTCMAVDQMGAIFSSKVENMVEDAPSTAEPHDVRQVWVAQKIVGTENHFTFKGHHGRYLGCNQYGFLSAMREAVSQEETFTCLPSPGESGQFDLRTTRSKYLTANTEKSPPELRGDADEAGEATTMRIRMQARFKPKLKVEKEEKVRAKISRKEIEAEVGRKLEDNEIKTLKKARREGNYHEAMLDVKVKGKHDKFA